MEKFAMVQKGFSFVRVRSVKYIYKHYNEIPSSVNGGEFLDHVSD